VARDYRSFWDRSVADVTGIHSDDDSSLVNTLIVEPKALEERDLPEVLPCKGQWGGRRYAVSLRGFTGDRGHDKQVGPLQGCRGLAVPIWLCGA
jgi:hypothetical protein